MVGIHLEASPALKSVIVNCTLSRAVLAFCAGLSWCILCLNSYAGISCDVSTYSCALNSAVSTMFACWTCFLSYASNSKKEQLLLKSLLEINIIIFHSFPLSLQTEFSEVSLSHVFQVVTGLLRRADEVRKKRCLVNPL